MDHTESEPLFPLHCEPTQVVQSLRQQIARIEQTRLPNSNVAVSSGSAALDRLLPEQGFRWGTLVEWLGAGSGSGAQTLALYAAREACREGGALVILDYLREFYPPAAVRLGIDPASMIVVHALSEADNLWALDQSLRSLGVAAVLAWPEKLDGHSFRRLQLAAEQGGGLGLLVRPEGARHEPSWADVRLLVETVPLVTPGTARRLKVHVLRSRGSVRGESVEVEVNDETCAVSLAPRLAHPADQRHATGT